VARRGLNQGSGAAYHDFPTTKETAVHTRTLLLTPWYFPIRILRWQDAVKMKYEDTVDVVVEYEDEIRSPSVTWRVPAVVRLRHLPKRNGRGVRFGRRNVYLRDDYRCQYCGEKKAARELSFDHVVPRFAGGRTTWENIVTACRPCNARKDAQTCDEVGMWPLRAPRRPATLSVAPPLFDREVPREWHGFTAGFADRGVASSIR
jgi:5-methylcytosine-specific restriction endonuclease McrA